MHCVFRVDNSGYAWFRDVHGQFRVQSAELPCPQQMRKPQEQHNKTEPWGASMRSAEI